MGNLINTSLLIPLTPLVTALLIFVLLASFNRTINRLTKPVTGLIASSLLISAFISTLYYFRKIEEELILPKFLKYFEEANLVLHFNLMNEKIIILFSLIMTFLIGFSFYKLPRKKGYVSFMVGIGIISSSIIFSVLFLDFSSLI